MDPFSDLTSAFETLQTNSKDDIITQMLLLTNLDRNSACFYLESSNWNVQNAIDLFYKNDCQVINNLDHNCNARDDSEINFIKLPPDTHFEKIFKVTNCGGRQFPVDARLRLFSGADIVEDRSQTSVPILVPMDFNPEALCSSSNENMNPQDVNLPSSSNSSSIAHNNPRSLNANESLPLKVTMKSPSNPGFFETQWKVYSKGYYFGQIFKIFLEVSSNYNNSIIPGFLDESQQQVWYNNSFEFDMRKAQEISLGEVDHNNTDGPSGRTDEMME